MSIDLLPYGLLLLAILAGWKLSTPFSLSLLATATISGLLLNRLEYPAIIFIGLLGLLIWLPNKLQLKNFAQFFCLGIFLLLAVAMSNHLVPGFNNLSVFKKIQFSTDSAPFSMYLNFDKICVGLFIYLGYIKNNQNLTIDRIQLFFSIKTLSLLLVFILPAAIIIKYVRIDLKFPELGWLWILNNFFFVCLAEEALFRGFIQKHLSNLLPKQKYWPMVSVFVAAVLFGLAHYKGGLPYILLATAAGCFYGYAYQKTNRIESAIIVHFGLNLVHFLFFSYPAMIAR